MGPICLRFDETGQQQPLRRSGLVHSALNRRAAAALAALLHAATLLLGFAGCRQSRGWSTGRWRPKQSGAPAAMLEAWRNWSNLHLGWCAGARSEFEAMTGMPIRQCPRCELRFTSSSELEDHLSNDHRPRPGIVEDVIPAALPKPTSPSPPESVAGLGAAPQSRGGGWIRSLPRRLWLGVSPSRHRSDDHEHRLG